MKSPVVNVGRYCLDAKVWTSVRLLFISDEMLRRFSSCIIVQTPTKWWARAMSNLDIGYYASILMTMDRARVELSREVRVYAETLPVAPPKGTTAQRTSIGTQHDVHYNMGMKHEYCIQNTTAREGAKTYRPCS